MQMNGEERGDEEWKLWVGRREGEGRRLNEVMKTTRDGDREG